MTPGGTVALRTVFLHVTKACNLACSYCYFSARQPLPGELSTAELTRLFPDLVEVGPAKVVFTGGEPLLRRDLVELLRALRAADPDHRVLRCLNTNGLLVTEELARSLVGLADEVRVSVDGLRDRNDAVRGEGCFDAAVRALETFHAVGFEPKALVTVTRETLPDLPDLVRFLRARRISRVNVNAFRPIGRGAAIPEQRVAPTALATAVRAALGSEALAPTPEDASLGCGVGAFLNVLPDGEVYPCHVLTDGAFRLGNLRERGLREICSRAGLLGRLGAIPGRTCLGEVLARTPA